MAPLKPMRPGRGGRPVHMRRMALFLGAGFLIGMAGGYVFMGE